MNQIYQSSGSLLLRKSLFPFSNLFDQKGDTKNLNDLVLDFIENDLFLEALYWASPQLYKAVIAYKNGGNNKKEEKLFNTLKKYIVRSCTRSTPYGIFAGCAVIESGKKSKELQMVRKVRIDMGLLQQLIDKINSDRDIWTHLHYSLNSSVYKVEKQFRFVESSVDITGGHYKISSIKSTPLINKIVNKTKNTSVTISFLFSSLGKNIKEEYFIDFIDELVKSQLLVSETQLGITIVDPISKIESILNRVLSQGVSSAKAYLTIIDQIRSIISLYEKREVGYVPVQDILNLEKLLDQQDIQLNNGHIFHADLRTSLPDNFFISDTVVKDVIESVPVLAALKTSKSMPERELELFVNAFVEKYESVEMPLTEVLDPEFGIGFPVVAKFGDAATNLFSDVDLVKEKEKIETPLHEIIELSACPSIKKIDLLEKYANKLPAVKWNLSDNIAVLGIHTASGEIFIQSVGGAHANILTARFSYLDDRLEQLCRDAVNNDVQKQKDVIFAEIVHFPEGRVANVLRHEPFYDYEIPYLSKSGVSNKKQIPVDDLVISIQGKEIILRSKRLNKRVIPRLSNAHNFVSSKIPIYRFLAFIQHQGSFGLEVSLSNSINYRRYTPRIQYGKVIFSRATWTLHRIDIEEINQSSNAIEKLNKFITLWVVPQFICFCEGDNELFLDIGNADYLRILLNEIKKKPAQIKLVEWLDIKVSNNSDCGSFQFVLPLQTKNNTQYPPINLPKEKKSINRVFAPGDEWVYIKLYCNAHCSDEILSSILKPSYNYFLKNGIISEAFFIRYTDPHYHLRIRFHLINKKRTGDVVSFLQKHLKKYLNSKVVWKVQLDTYIREIERYGHESMTISESLFHIDSIFFLQMLSHKWFVDDEFMRFLAGIKSVHYWFDAFGLTVDERIAFCKQQNELFLAEFDNAVKKDLDIKYRNWKLKIIDFIGSNQCHSQLMKRQRKIRNLLLPIKNLDNYIHMSLNRWFITQQRLMEWAIYLYLHNIYKQTLYKDNNS